eukprot:GHVP01053746.1.p1 GENE.GHVP01053746.1~~GHVP01053746.1.p1  ORF type:complete len:100 (+),score=1.99 GHVP01053746.1:177-476(+)
MLQEIEYDMDFRPDDLPPFDHDRQPHLTRTHRHWSNLFRHLRLLLPIHITPPASSRHPPANARTQFFILAGNSQISHFPLLTFLPQLFHAEKHVHDSSS